MSKVIIITGASKNLGKSLAIGLSRKGHKMVLAGRNLFELTEVGQRIPGEYLAIECDITDYPSCQSLISKTVEKFGKVDVLINNASLFLASNLQDSSIEQIDSILDATVKGTLYTTKAALESMSKNHAGQVLSILPSQYRHGLGKTEMTPYSTAKFALVGMLESLKREGASKGVKATSLFVDSMASTLDLDDSDHTPDNLISPQVVVDTIDFVISQPTPTVIDDLTISQVNNF
jgi:NADP-dependent 3-hydroxy acid dehydrogenase YdfG